jgi:hypothetical protein
MRAGEQTVCLVHAACAVCSGLWLEGMQQQQQQQQRIQHQGGSSAEAHALAPTAITLHLGAILKTETYQ